MSTWIVGDIHGCAEELAQLVERIGLKGEDQLLSCGDLFHRGPDPVGVIDILESCGAHFILGNHERVVLKRCNLAPRLADGSDRPPLRVDFPSLDARDLAGDGRRPCAVEPQDRARVLRYLQSHSGYYQTNETLSASKPTPDGRPWWLVHAGILPGMQPAQASAECLTSVRRLRGRGCPWWYEAWAGPALVLFGHTPGPAPRATRVHGRLVSLGLDTGCVYGGSLTAYSPDLDEFVSVKASQPYVRMA